MNLQVMTLSLAATLGVAGAAQADIVTDWNDVWLDAVRTTGGGPCQISRNGAIVAVSVYEAVNSIKRTHEPYIGFIDPGGTANLKAAVSAAAHRALVTQYPALQSTFDAELTEVLATIPNSPAKTRGIALGEAAADQVIASRADDNSNVSTPYTFGNEPGDYIIDNPDLFGAPHGPNWWQSSPWVIPSIEAFQPSKPLRFRNKANLLASKGYAKQVNEVRRFGERNSTVRTPEQTEIAWFWANDRDGTFKPPGHLNDHAQVVSEMLGLDVAENARLLALLNLALADSVLVTWSAKYNTDIDLWRPQSAIRLADLDNNSRTTADPAWEPLLEFTPPFPAYTSGHSGMGGVWAGILSNFVGTDDFTYTVGTDEPIVSEVTRTFHSFSEAGRENAISRIYLGVHYRMDCEQSYASGVAIADYIYNNALRPICPADFDGNGTLNSGDMYQFAAAYFQHKPEADYDDNGTINGADMTKYVRDHLRGCN
jgi:hypothetical protein